VTYSKNATFVANPDVVSSALGDGAALLDLKASVYYSLNAVGAYVWNALQSPTSLSSLVAAVSDQFDVEPARCEADLRSILGALADAKLVEISNAEAA
jgi:hypothetical protein